jgi:hypothetical protein
VYRLAADDVAGMPFIAANFHQPVFAVFPVQRKGLPYNERSTACSEEQADVRVYACHIQYHHEDERTEQPTCENEQVLCFQPLNSTVLPMPLLIL